MARFTADERRRSPARSSAGTRVPKSALIPLLHLAQEQDGYVTDDAMEHIAELVGVTPAEVLGTCQLLRDVQARAGRPLPRQRLHQHLLPCSSAATSCCTTPRRRSASRPAAPPPTALFTLEDVECIAACTEAPVPPGQLPLLPPGHPRRASTSSSTTSAPAGATTRSRRTARSPASASTSRPTAPPATAARPASRRAGVAAPADADAERGARLDGRHRRPEDHHQPLRPRRRATRSTRYEAHRRLRGPAQARSAMTPAAGRRRGQDAPACSAAAAPASPPA